jgi:hypothetical protein
MIHHGNRDLLDQLAIEPLLEKNVSIRRSCTYQYISQLAQIIVAQQVCV